MKRGKGDAPTGLGRRIEKIVSDTGMMKKDFAISVGVSPNYIYQIIAGKKTSISPSLAKLIETLYGYPSGWVLGGEDRKE
jgi:predicted transcriptional regulator